ncbi:tripartite motif-containing protein 43-like [Dipodomys merriami]|uniref:tripartite motif-containing protein 43-like n=1 Tax=Dipodomys merriami TaxID=94247 RepID=UPI003855BF4E
MDINLILNVFSKELICLLCLNYLMDPVTLGCKHTFCRPCLYISREKAQHPFLCPECKKPYQTDLKTDIVLSTKVFMARRTLAFMLSNSEEEMCNEHRQTKNFYCEVVKDQICSKCCRTEEHRAHGDCSVDWTAERYRKKLLMQMNFLWKKKEENQRNLDEQKNINQTWLKIGEVIKKHELVLKDYVNMRSQLISDEYWRLSDRWYKKKESYLQRLECEKLDTFQKLSDNEGSMLLTETSLGEMFDALKELCRKPDLELLENFENMFKRSESMLMLHIPLLMHPRIDAWPITGFIRMLKQFQVSVSWESKIPTYPVPLLEELRSRIFGPSLLEVSQTQSEPEGFLTWGDQSCASGRYYWEVDVKDHENWAVGFCDDSWTMRKDMRLDSEGIHLLFCVKQGKGIRMFTSSPLLPQYIKKPPGHVGVFLDYEVGRINFVDVANNSPIFSFLSCPFSSPPRPFFALAPVLKVSSHQTVKEGNASA